MFLKFVAKCFSGVFFPLSLVPNIKVGGARCFISNPVKIMPSEIIIEMALQSFMTHKIIYYVKNIISLLTFALFLVVLLKPGRTAGWAGLLNSLSGCRLRQRGVGEDCYKDRCSFYIRNDMQMK